MKRFGPHHGWRTAVAMGRERYIHPGRVFVDGSRVNPIGLRWILVLPKTRHPSRREPMLRFDANRSVRFCDGLTRRDFLHAGAIAPLGLTLPHLFAQKAAGAA